MQIKKGVKKKILIGVIILIGIIFTDFLVATTRITDTFIETGKIKPIQYFYKSIFFYF